MITDINASASHPGDAGEGDAVIVTASFADVGDLDTHTAHVDWEVGSGSSADVAESDGSGSVSASHAYEYGGGYTVVTVTDDDGESAPPTGRHRRPAGPDAGDGWPRPRPAGRGY